MTTKPFEFTAEQNEVLARIQSHIIELEEAKALPANFEHNVLPMENPWVWTDGSICLIDITDWQEEVHLQIRFVDGKFQWEDGGSGSDNSAPFRISNTVEELEQQVKEHLLDDLQRITKEAQAAE